MTYKPLTTAEQRAALVDVVSTNLPRLKGPMRELVKDLEQAEELIREMRTPLHPQLLDFVEPPAPQCQHPRRNIDTAGEYCFDCGMRLNDYVKEDQEIEGCLHPNFDWDGDTTRLHPRFCCTTCGAEKEDSSD